MQFLSLISRRFFQPQLQFRLFARWRRVLASATGFTVISTTGLLGCSALDANAPNTLQHDDLNNITGAQIIVAGVRRSVSDAFGDALKSSGALTDEWLGGSRYDWQLQYRNRADYLTNVRSARLQGRADDLYYKWQTAYRDASIALTLLRTAAPVSIRGALMGEVFALRGFVLTSIAEQICPGFPIAHVDVSADGKIVTPRFTSDPQTADSAFTRALVDFDSAVVYAGDSARIVALARVGMARAQLGLGQFAMAQTATTQVPADFEYAFVRTDFTFRFELMGSCQGCMNGGYRMYDREGTNGLDFVSANDPRVVATPYETNHLFAPYIATNPSIIVASSTEAQLIQAEAQLAAAPNDVTGWLQTLNTLRQTVGLADTTDPGTTTARVDLLFRERAFWLFGTAHRLGDFRRLMARYGRNSETLFPIGISPNGQPITGTLTNIPFDGAPEHQRNSKITGCIDAS